MCYVGSCSIRSESEIPQPNLHLERCLQAIADFDPSVHCLGLVAGVEARFGEVER
jgi:hypothetical protein